MAKKKFRWGVAAGVAGALGALAWAASSLLKKKKSDADMEFTEEEVYGDDPNNRRVLSGLGFVTPAVGYGKYAPGEVVDLPFNLLRSTVPVGSPVQIQAIEQFRAQQPQVVAMLPGEMLLSKWTDGAGAFGAGAAGAVEAMDSMRGLEVLQQTPVPQQSLRQVAAELNQFLPNTGEAYENPIARGLSQIPQLTENQLSVYAHMQSDIESSAPAQWQTPQPPAVSGQDQQAYWDGTRMRFNERF